MLAGFAYKYKSNRKRGYADECSYWHWRRVVSLVVLITFSSSIFSPVFALNLLSANESHISNHSSTAIKTKYRKLKPHHLVPTLIQSKTNKNIGSQFNQPQNQLFSAQNKYQPYLEIGGAKYFNQASRAASICDLFIPLLQSDDQLVFADLRVFDRTGSASEGNLHLGFRKLYPDTKQMWGVYGAFDQKRSNRGNSFNQITIGIEYWNNSWFVGGNIYKPIGTTSRYIGKTQAQELMFIGRDVVEIKTTTNTSYEKALSGIDAEIGYAITDNLTSYIGGYYFSAKNTESIVGPKIRLTYDYQKTTGRILGILDGVSVEAGAQHDKSRGGSAYVGIKFKVGLTNLKKNSNIFGFERHMVELVRRDPDVVVGQVREEKVESKKIKLPNKNPSNGDVTSNPKPKLKPEPESKPKPKPKPKSSGGELVVKDEESEAKKVSLKKLLKDFGLPENATLKDAKKLHHKYAFIYHPDRNKDGEKKFIYYQNLFEEIKKAFSSDPVPTSQNGFSDAARASSLEPKGEVISVSEFVKNNTIQLKEDTKRVFTQVQPTLGDSIEPEREIENVIQLKEDTKQSSVVVPSFMPVFTQIQPQNNFSNDVKADRIEPQKKVIKIEQYVRNNTEQSINSRLEKTSVVTQSEWKGDASITTGFNLGDSLFDSKRVSRRRFFYAESDIELSNDILSAIKNLVITPIRYLDYIVDTVFTVLIPIKATYALEIPASLDPDIVIKQYLEKRDNGVEDLVNMLSTVDANSIELGESSINYLEKIIKEGDGGKHDIQVLKSIAWVLTGYVTHYAKDATHVVFLVDLVKHANIAPVVKEYIINKFTKDVDEVKIWRDSKVFDSFAALLPYDDSRNLASALTKAYKNHGYVASYEALPYFEQLLDNASVKEGALVVIAGTLEKLLSLGSNLDFDRIQKHLDILLNKTDNLPPGLVSAIFEEHSNGCHSLAKSIVNLLAENKHLPAVLLQKFINPLTQLKDPNISLFIALRLVQNHIILPVDKLKYFIRFLNAGDDALRIAAVKLYDEINKKIPPEIRSELADALIAVLPKMGALLYSRVNKLLQGFELIQEQKIKHDLQQRAYITARFSNAVLMQRDLLKNLIVQIKQESKLSVSDQDALETSVERLSDWINWPVDFLFDLINKTYQNNITDVSLLITALEKLSDYVVDPEMIDREGLTALTILKTKPVAEMLPAISRLIKDNNFFVELDIDSLLEKFEELNQDNPETIKLIKSGYLKSQFSRANKIKQQWPEGLRGITKQLAAWTAEDYIAWSKAIAVVGMNDSNVAEIIAVLSAAAHKTVFEGGYDVRPAQQLSVFVLFKSIKGILEQVGPGEGKSIIIAMYAAIHALQGGQVDIVTSAPILAKHDALEHQIFYNLFGLDASYNTDSKNDGEPQDCYLSPIVYGTVLHFNGDVLSDTSANIKHGRASDLVIVDEWDVAGFDQSNTKVQLSRDIPGFNILGYLLTYMWGGATNLRSMLQQRADGCHLQVSLPDENEEAAELKKIILLGMPQASDGATNNFDLMVGSSCIDYFRTELTNFTTETIFAFGHMPNSRSFIVPHNWEQVAIDHLHNWIQALLLSFQYVEGVDYILARRTESDFLQVTLVDKKGGVIQHNLHLADGLHQFIGLEHKLVMLPESFTSVFMSYPGFFKRYNRICGLSGTLGGLVLRDFFEKKYDVNLSIIPSFAPKSLTKFPPIYVTDETVLPVILGIIRRKIAGKRACLIAMPAIKLVEVVFKHLSTQLKDDTVRLFTFGIGNEAEDKRLIERKLRPGDVIIGTPLVGRGINFRPNPEVINNGGLHVLQGTISENRRAADQVANRAARADDPGSVQQMVNIDNIKRRFNIDCKGVEVEDCLAKVYEAIDKNESQEVRNRMEKDFPYMDIQDDLYALFVKFVSELDTPTGYQISVGKPQSSAELKPSTLCLYKEDTKIGLGVTEGQEIKDVVKENADITELIKSIDSRAAKHIAIFLSNSNHTKATSGLNKQDRELIYFIANKNGYPQTSKNYDCAQAAFAEAIISSRGDKQQYLKALLAGYDQFEDLRKDNTRVDDQVLLKVEARKLFLFWLEGRKLSNEEFKTRQLEEKFGIWLRKQECFHPVNYQVYTSAEQLEEKIHDCREQSINGFFAFKNLMLTQMAENKFMENYAYVVLEAWRKLQIQMQQPGDNILWQVVGGAFSNNDKVLLESISSLERVEKLEPDYSWPIDNVMANLILIKDGSGIFTYDENDDSGNLKKANEVKSKYYEYENHAIKKISKCIETASTVLTFLLAQRKITYTDGYAIQLRAYIKFHEEVAAKLQNNMDIVFKSSMTEMVRAKNLIEPEKIKQKIDLKTAVLQSINAASGIEPAARQSLQQVVESFDFTKEQKPIVDKISDQVLIQGGFIIEIEKYALKKEEESGFEAFFVGIMSVVCMVAGIMLAPYGGVFLQSFAVSLVSKGVSDMIQVLIAIGTGSPINLSSYLTSTAMSLGIALVASSILFFVDKIIPALGVAGRVADAANSLNVGTMALIQTSSTAVGALLGKLGSNFIDEGDIKARAEAEIDNVINSREEKDALKDIFATDTFNDNSNLVKVLYNLVERVVRKCQEMFQDDETKFGVGVGKNVVGTVAGKLNGAGGYIGLGNVIQTGTDVAMGSIKNAKALGEVVQGIKAAIKEVASMALKSGAMMTDKLTKVFDRDNIGVELVGALTSQGYILNGEINYADCSSLNNVQLNEKLSGYKPGIIEVCNSIKDLLFNGYQSSYAMLKNDWVNRITGTITSIQKHEIMQPMADGVAVEVGTRIGEGLGKLIIQAANGGKVISEQAIDDKYLQKSPYEKAANDAKNSLFEPTQSDAVSDMSRQTDAHTGNVFSGTMKGFDSYLKKSAIEQSVTDSMDRYSRRDNLSKEYQKLLAEYRHELQPNTQEVLNKFLGNLEDLILEEPTQQDASQSKSPTVMWLDGRTSIDETKLAWWVERNINAADSVAKPEAKVGQNNDENKEPYVPLPTTTNLNTHWGIELGNKDRDVVGYFDDSTVHWKDSDLKNYYSRLKLFGHYEVGFDNEIMNRALQNIANRWDKNDGKQFDGIKYSLKDHNCQHFIVNPVFEEYLRNQGKFYIKPVPYNLFHLEDKPR